MNHQFEQRIETLFGSDALKYYKNKQKGGAANQKGGDYENFFSVMQLAKLFCLLFDNKQQDIEIHTQAEAFVDDLLIIDNSDNGQHHFQLKNTDKVNWGSDSKSISNDFYRQKVLNDNVGIEHTQASLVCSNQQRVNQLHQEIPVNIAEFSDVVFFPYAQTLNQLLFLHEEFKNWIKSICYSDEIDKLEALATIILGHWCNKKTTINSVQALFSDLQKHFPNHLAKVGIVMKLLPEVEAIFSKITDFAYFTEKGYFNWDYKKGLDSGVLFYPIDSQEFSDFQQAIIKHQPSNFSELEGLLLWTDNSQSM